MILFYFLLNSMLCLRITLFIYFEAEMIPKIRSSYFYILFYLAVMLYLLVGDCKSSRLEKFLLMFCESRLPLSLKFENSLLRVFLAGKKSLGSFWWEMIMLVLRLAEKSLNWWILERGILLSKKDVIINKFNKWNECIKICQIKHNFYYIDKKFNYLINFLIFFSHIKLT